MNLLLKQLSRIVVIITIVSVTYLEPKVLTVQSQNDQVQHPNNTTMIDKNQNNLDLVTINFLNAIEESGQLFDVSSYSMREEVIVRVRLRDAFEAYFGTIMPMEARVGLETTEHSREVVQDTIAEYMESDSPYHQTMEITKDLDAYSKVLTESVIHAAVGV